MTARRIDAGAMMFELVISLVLSLVLSAAIVHILTTGYARHTNVTATNAAIQAAAAPIDAVADHIRSAQLYASDGHAAIANAQDDEITYYATDGGATVRYFRNGSDLQRTDGSGTTTVLTHLDSLSFSYLLLPKYNYHTYTQPADGTSLTDAERRAIAIVYIRCTATVDGVPRDFSTFVRLRNSPRKTGL